MKDHPAAFPNTGNSTWNLEPEAGMSLRDWFAGQALAGSDFMECVGWTHIDLAKYAYSLADAMLEARKTGGAA